MTLFSFFCAKDYNKWCSNFLEGTKETGIEQKNVKRKHMRWNSLKGWFPSQTRFLECHQPNRTELKILWFESDQMTQVSNTFEASLYIQRGNYILSQSRKASCKEKNLTRLAIWTIPQNGKVIYLSVQSFSPLFPSFSSKAENKEIHPRK